MDVPSSPATGDTLALQTRYRTLMESCPDPVLIIDRNGGLLESSRSATDLFGGAGGSVPVDDVRELFDEFPLEQTLRQTDDQPVVQHVTARDSRRNTFPARIQISRAAGNGQPFWIVHVRNLTDLQSSQADLFAAREAWAQCFNALPDHICLLDLTGAILKANTSMKNRFEPTHGPLEGVDYRLIYCGTATPDPQPPCAAVLCGGPSVTLETALPAVPGWFVVSSYPLHNSAGELWGAVSVVKDVTERRQAQLDLDRLFETSIDACCIMERNTQLKRVNQSFCESFGIPKDCEPHSLLELVHPDDALETRQRLERLEAGVEIRGYRIRCMTNSGEYRWFSWSIPPATPEESAVCAIGRDVTELELSEQLLRVARQKAEDANAAKSQFLATVSHEMRTPLHAINGALELIVTASDSDDGLLQTCQESATSLRRLIDDILDCSQMESGHLRLKNAPLLIRDVVDQCVRRFAKAADAAGIRIDAIIDESVPESVQGDAERLIQVLTNLLSNSLKFTTQGSVSLAVRLEHRSRDRCRLCFEVIDTGVGIHPDHKDRIFRIFQQADNSMHRPAGGLGLGLWISRRIVESMKGTIDVESQPDRGTHFRVELPFRIIAPPHPDLSPDSDHAARRRLRILLADDDRVGARITRAMLEYRHHTVDYFPDGRSVLTAMSQNDAHYDLILMDLMMPEIDGIQTTQQIRRGVEKFRSIPILAVSAHAMPDAAGLCRRAGINGYLAKPFSRRQLEDAMGAVLSIGTTTEQPAVDRQELLQRCNGDIALINSLTDIFEQAASGDVTTIRQALEDRDHEQIRAVSHRLKGTLQHLCAHQAALVIVQISELSLSDRAKSEQLLQDLELQIARIGEELRSVSSVPTDCP
ncbi:MAG: PAS domain S-box protein [Planctomycetaceae bacterium]|nr:PAS domain S-box protein [Planctomycetaceae bacterium]